MRKIATVFFLCFATYLFSQQKVFGKIIDEDQNNLNSVLVFNITKNTKTFSRSSGEFNIEAEENDELRFVKAGFFRNSKIVKTSDFNSTVEIKLLRAATLIQEVEINYKPTGNLKKDSKHFDDSKKIAEEKASLRTYMKSELKEPLPKNEVPKSFRGHDFNAGQIDLFRLSGAVAGLIKKAVDPKITTPNFIETQNFLQRVKSEVNLDTFRSYGMDEERIDHFLLYAETVNHLSKRFRKKFDKSVILNELQSAFVEYSKLNKLSD